MTVGAALTTGDNDTEGLGIFHDGDGSIGAGGCSDEDVVDG